MVVRIKDVIKACQYADGKLLFFLMVSLLNLVLLTLHSSLFVCLAVRIPVRIPVTSLVLW